MFGRAQRTSLPSLPSQNTPIDFLSAASSKDAAQTRAKLYNDRSKLSLTSLSPGQAVHLQDSKSSAWDKQGIIVSMRPDRLSYVVKIGNRFFTRPRRLLRPVIPPATPSPVVSTTPPSSSLPILRRSPRFQSNVNTAVLQNSSLLRVPVSSTSSPKWPLCSSATDTTLSNGTKWSRRSKSTSHPQPLLPPPLSRWRTTPASTSITASPTNPATSAWTNQTMGFPLLTSTGRHLVPGYPLSLPSFWQDSLSRAVVTSAGVVNANPAPATPNF